MKRHFATISGLCLLFLMFSSVVVQASAFNFKQVITPTVTPVPARDLDLLNTFISVSTKFYPNCELPCLWGLTPGKTKLSEFTKFLAQTGFDRDWRRSNLNVSLKQYFQYGESIGLYFEDSINDPLGPFPSVELSPTFDQNDILTNMVISLYGPDNLLLALSEQWSFPQILKHINEIPEIYFEETPNVDTPWSENVIVFYSNKRVKFDYGLDTASQDIRYDRPGQRLCFNMAQTTSIKLTLITPEHHKFDDLESDRNYVYTVQKVFGLDVNGLIQFFKKHIDGCLITHPTDMERPITS